MGVLKIQGVGFDQSCSPMEHADSFRIKISIAAMYRLIDMIFYVRNAFKNTNFPIHEILCVSLPPYYTYWFPGYQYMHPIYS